MTDYLYTIIEYNVIDDSFKSAGNLNSEGEVEVIESFLRSQTDQVNDPNPIDQRDVYSVKLKWFAENDVIKAESDTGNKSLRDGLLLEYLRRKND